MKAKVSDSLLCELHILRNRLEAGESILQCLAKMGAPLEGPPHFREKWESVCKLMLEGRILPAKAVADVIDQFAGEKKLIELVQQKTLSPRIQAFLSIGLVSSLLASAYFIFPLNLRPSLPILLAATILCVFSAWTMHLLLKRLSAKLCYLDWIFFQKGLCLSLQCGLSFPTALFENFPNDKILQSWPRNFSERLSCTQNIDALSFAKDPLWSVAARAWNTLLEQHEGGLPLSEMLRRLARIQEDLFKNWIQNKAEKMSYLLLLPLFLLSVPAVLILLFGPLLAALR